MSLIVLLLLIILLLLFVLLLLIVRQIKAMADLDTRSARPTPFGLQIHDYLVPHKS
jgi:hypothetical protein